MLNSKIKKINFYHNLVEKQNIPECISRISYADNDNILYKSDNLFNEKLGDKKIYSIQVIPDYFSFHYNALFNKKVLKENRKGYASKLSEFKDVKRYVRSQYRKNAKPIFKNIKRLESCFEIRYVLFYGEIETTQYDFLLERLHIMLTNRFKQRNDSNYFLNTWTELYTRTFNLIKQKKASLLIIYNGDEPIQINIQYHFKDILFGSVASYDIDYQSFGLGNTAIYKQIEWCLDNGYTVFDQGHGDLAYKRRWSNLIYNFEHHVVYSKNNIKSSLRAKIEVLKLKVKAYLRKKKAIDALKRSKNYFSKESKESKEINNKEISFEITELENLKDEINKFTLINWQSLEYNFLRKCVCDFLYYNFEHYNDIEVFQHNSEKNKFVIKGKNHFQKVIFH